MTADVSIKTSVDLILLDKIEEEYFQILHQQRVIYNERWCKPAEYLNSLSSLRWIMITLSLLGALLCIYYLLYPGSCPRWLYAELYLVFFVASSVLFYFTPRFHTKYITWLKKLGRNSCKRMARRYLSQARKLIPYDAEYIIKGDLISYYRGKDEKWKQLWSRRLKGYAVIGTYATILFKKPTSIIPAMLILYDNNDAIETVVKELGMSYKINISERQLPRVK